jgi:uncharacterized protein (DUF2147 family)
MRSLEPLSLVPRSVEFLLVAALLSAPIAWAAPGPGASICGDWLTADGESVVSIFQATDGTLAGKITDLSDDEWDEPDVENMNPALRSRPLLYLQLMSGFVATGEGSWDDGTIYDPYSGVTFSALLKHSARAPSRLEVRGYIGTPMIGRSEYWVRLPDLPSRSCADPQVRLEKQRREP